MHFPISILYHDTKRQTDGVVAIIVLFKHSLPTTIINTQGNDNSNRDIKNNKN